MVALTADTLDSILTCQFVVAWAGEGGEEPRLNWWRTDLVSEFGGEDLFKRLLPSTWRWAILQAVRLAAITADAQLRAKSHDPDSIVTLFRYGFEIDEKLDERLQDLKRSGRTPFNALPELEPLLSSGWRRGAFEAWLGRNGAANSQQTPAGRQLRGDCPDDYAQRTAALVAGLLPLSERYPVPHFRRRA